MSTSNLNAVEVVGVLVAASITAVFLFPLALRETAGVPSAGWSDGSTALWGIFPQVMLLALFAAFLVLIMAAVGDW